MIYGYNVEETLGSGVVMKREGVYRNPPGFHYG